ncbi:MAG: zinc ribbon domain-containing protein [Gammaproteobacteria bacterium]|nr:zinc ribbon domain-containing protein [Gammaproteobacteria bacterium]
MPIYEYECENCGHRLEAIQKMSEAPLKDCPACGKPGLKKQISAAGFQLKGSGWYATDFKGSGQKKEKSEKTEKSGSDPTPTPPTKKAGGCGGGNCGHSH